MFAARLTYSVCVLVYCERFDIFSEVNCYTMPPKDKNRVKKVLATKKSVGKVCKSKKTGVKPSTRQGRPRKTLSLEFKLELIARLEKGVPAKTIINEYNLPPSTVYDLNRDKDKVKDFAKKITTKTKHNKERRTMRKAKFPSVELALVKWFRQLRECNVMVRSVEMMDVAERFAKHQRITGFKASKGWLNRFKQRHGIRNRKAYGESADADTRFVEDFKKDFLATIDKYKLSKPQIYNCDESGLYWKSVPTNTVADYEDEG